MPMACRPAGPCTAALSWRTAIAPLTLGGEKHGLFRRPVAGYHQANATLADDSEHQGQSVRFLYNKSLDETGTNLQLVGYRYSTRGYHDFADTTYRRMSGYSVETQDGVIRVKPKFTDYYNLAYSKRGKVQLSVTQQLGRACPLSQLAATRPTGAPTMPMSSCGPASTPP